MQVAIIADLHNNLDAWHKIKEILNWQNIKHLIVAGDITSIETLDNIAKDYQGEIEVVFGNMDQNPQLMELFDDKYSHMHIHGFNGAIIIDNKNFLLSHYQQELEDQAKVKQGFYILCCGHTHEKKELRKDNYLIINPGTAGGIFQNPSFAVYDTTQDQVKFIDL